MKIYYFIMNYTLGQSLSALHIILLSWMSHRRLAGCPAPACSTLPKAHVCGLTLKETDPLLHGTQLVPIRLVAGCGCVGGRIMEFILFKLILL